MREHIKIDEEVIIYYSIVIQNEQKNMWYWKINSKSRKKNEY